MTFILHQEENISNLALNSDLSHFHLVCIAIHDNCYHSSGMLSKSKNNWTRYPAVTL